MPTTVPLVAEITVMPALAAVARPAEPVAFEIVAVARVEDAQVTIDVRFCVVVSLYVPVAVNCCVRPLATDGAAGVMARLVSVAAVTASVAVPVTPLLVAEIVVVPTATLVATPRDPAAFEIVAVATVPEDQVAVAVSASVGPSLNMPVAGSGLVVPLASG